ncbi:hypothetical protein IQ07DRAFT_72602 [Pyrenochaeta sp. DS3sAY3a]|nr:hypothetical protein IQ07DRAFT_72602 [Pyrenochaeta sp. DS3sAY3a]
MAPISKLVTILSLSLFAAAQGTQFITGPCTSDADCAAGCCGFNTGKCAGPIVALERDGGCGFGDAQPNDNAAQALRGAAPAPVPNAPGNAKADATPPAAPPAQTAAPAPAGNGNGNGNGAGNGTGKQFITGPCTSDADCAAGCCGFTSGKCAGPVVAQERDGGCGFGDAAPNDNAAQALQGRRLGRRGAKFM